MPNKQGRLLKNNKLLMSRLGEKKYKTNKNKTNNRERKWGLGEF